MGQIKNRESCFPLVTKPEGPATKQWTSFHLHFGARSTYFKIVLDRRAPAVGPYFTDVDRNIYLDFVSHVGAAPFGYNNPDMTEFLKDAPLMDPMRYAGTDYICGWGPTTDLDWPTPAHLHKKVHSIVKHLGLHGSFFTNSGAEAIENSIKLSYLNRKNRGLGISFDHAFHGRTLGALSLTHSKIHHKEWYPSIPNIVRLPYGTPGSSHDDLFALEKLLDKRTGLHSPDEISYIIVEPVQGEGGYRIPSKEFMKSLGNISKTHDIPLICDEVQSGMGRTGKWWACEHFGIRPQLMAAAKALRIGATIATKEFLPKDDGRIGSTFGEGNPLSTAMGYKTIEIIEKQKLLSNASKMGSYFLKQLKELESKKSVVEARGIGLMLAIELKTPALRDAVLEKCRRKGLLVAGAGWTSIRFIPPLDVRKREIDQCVNILRTAL